MRLSLMKYYLAVGLGLALLLVAGSDGWAAPPPQDADDATLNIINDSEQTICYVYISPVALDEWGDDWLGENEIFPPGESRAFDLPTGDYDVLLADCEGNELLDQRNITISDLYVLRFTGPDPCEALNQEGMTLYHQARYRDALQKFQDTLTCYREANDRKGEGTALNNIGFIYSSLEQYEEALRYYEDALTILREIGDHAGEGVSLIGIGFVYESLGQYEEALDYYRQALDLRQEMGDRAGEADVLHNIGGVYESLRQYDEALDYYQQSLTIFKEIGDHAGEGVSLIGIGLVYESLGQYEEALDYYRQALGILQEIGDRAGEGVTLAGIGALYYNVGRYEEALRYMEDALTILREIGDRYGEGAALHGMGIIYDNLGQYQEALDYYQQALTIRQKISDRVGEGTTLNGFGSIHYSRGQYQEALDYYQQALTIFKEIGHRAGEGGTLRNIGLVYYSLGQYEEALDYYQQALIIIQEIGGRAIMEGATLINIGNIHDYLGQYEEALSYCQQALIIVQEIGDRRWVGESLNSIGHIHLHLGRYEEALDYYQQSLTIFKEIGHHAGEGGTLYNIGLVYESLGQYEEALDYYRQALNIRQEIGDRAGEGASLNNIGFICYRLRQYEGALGHYEQAIAIAETIRGEMTSEELKSSFAAEQVSVYNNIVSLLTQMERPEDAFGYVQRAKARTFLDQLANVRVDPRATDDAKLLEREQELLGEIRALEDVLFGRGEFTTLSLDDTTRSGPPVLNNEQRDEVQTRLDAAYREYEQILIQIKLSNPEYASLRSVQASTLVTVQQTLPPDVTLVEYYVVSETQTLAFVVTQDSFHTEAISVTRDSLSLATSQFFTEIQTTLSGVPASLQQLHDALIVPIAPYLTDERIIIAPHDVLHYVPFAALHDGEEYLIEQHALVQLPSASVLPFILEKARRESSGGSPLILGDPDGSLRFSRREAQAVAELYNTTAHVGQAAREQLVWEQGPDASILHLATHGAYNAYAPLFSRILLAASAEEGHDGVLEVHEVYNLDLRQADLVVLSACQSNLGERSAGDEIVGLNRAFIYAGTPSVLASLWSVEDEATRGLMVGFYGYLRQGYAKDEALRLAQMDVMRNPRTAHPYYWAGFVLTGDGGEGVRMASAEEVKPTKETEPIREVEPTGDVENDKGSEGTPRSGLIWAVGVAFLVVVVGGGVWVRSRKK